MTESIVTGRYFRPRSKEEYIHPYVYRYGI
uniref:Uncharacterized protein n=1 Tax=Siphoviridae sp. ctDmQ3 TaxID=2823570 RepID=A0A8S5L801_9CAUD|nr:MAG TPA: hypothetical protein [Siphoviridae sp. ctDmQ3]